MPLQKHSPPLPRILGELIVAAICLFTLPLSFDWLSKMVHGSGGGVGRLVGILCVSILGIVLLVDVYRMMRQRSTVPSRYPDQNTGSRKI